MSATTDNATTWLMELVDGVQLPAPLDRLPALKTAPVSVIISTSSPRTRFMRYVGVATAAVALVAAGVAAAPIIWR